MRWLRAAAAATVYAKDKESEEKAFKFQFVPSSSVRGRLQFGYGAVPLSKRHQRPRHRTT